MNQMPGLIQEAKKSVTDYKAELSRLQTKSLSINRSVCNLDSVISSIQSSTQTQEQTIASLDAFYQHSENFIADVVRVDGNVADVINERKDNFYDEYSYLKPESLLEKVWSSCKSGLKKVGQWCKEHWQEILIGFACIVVGALLTFFTGGAFLPALLAGLKAAAIAGLISGGISTVLSIGASLIAGEDFTTLLGKALNAFEDGLASGFKFGGIFAGVSMSLSSGVRFAMAKFPRFSRFLLIRGRMSEEILKWLAPKGVKNTFVPSQRIADGYKYSFKIGNTAMELKWHSVDLMWKNVVGSNAGAGWTAQIKVGHKLLTTLGTWRRNYKNSLAHIPIFKWWKWW